MHHIIAGVVKLVDTLDLGSSASRCEGSSPFARTIKKASLKERLFYFKIICPLPHIVISLFSLFLVTFLCVYPSNAVEHYKTYKKNEKTFIYHLSTAIHIICQK